MNKYSVRIESICLENFKNVRYGEINLENKKCPYKASVLGLYGQNGSGKTALIDSLNILQYALSGRSLPAKYIDYINKDAECASLKFQLSAKRDAAIYHAWYEFSIRADEVPDEEPSAHDKDAFISNPKLKATIYNECLKFQYTDDSTRLRMAPLIDARNGKVFLPRSRYIELVGSDKKTATELLVASKLSEEGSKSFLFSRTMINTIRANCQNPIYLDLVENLLFFGMRELFVISMDNSGLINLHALPITFKYRSVDEEKEYIGRMALPLNKSVLIPVEKVEFVKNMLNSMNIVLQQIIPGLKINVHELSTELSKDAQTCKRLELVSSRKGKDIPLRYESDGIKKIISILQLLIVVYNSDSITVAIDELDSGVFEYLLGELLRVISEKGKGQLIFTSHNLRPLETIDKSYIAFTTVNPDHRYIRFVNVKGNNNLRDFYYRDITLGEQSEPVYEATNNYEIMLAFKEAGEGYDTQKSSSGHSGGPIR